MRVWEGGELACSVKSPCGITCIASLGQGAFAAGDSSGQVCAKPRHYCHHHASSLPPPPSSPSSSSWSLSSSSPSVRVGLKPCLEATPPQVLNPEPQAPNPTPKTLNPGAPIQARPRPRRTRIRGHPPGSGLASGCGFLHVVPPNSAVAGLGAWGRACDVENRGGEGGRSVDKREGGGCVRGGGPYR